MNAKSPKRATYVSDAISIRLRLGNGTATLSWSGRWRQSGREAFPDAALDVLCGIRLAIETG